MDVADVSERDVKDVGRGFTKRRYRKYSPAELIAMLTETAMSAEPPTFAELRESLRCSAEAILKDAGLPYRLNVTYKIANPREWSHDTPPEMLAGFGSARISHYILRVLGIEHDAKDGTGFAAQIIEAAAESERPEMERALAGAFNLGRFSAEARSYSYAKEKGRSRGSKKNPAKNKAAERLRSIIMHKPNISEADAWSALAWSGTDHDDIELSGEGSEAVITVDCNAGQWDCKRSSFYRVLFAPIRDCVKGRN